VTEAGALRSPRYHRLQGGAWLSVLPDPAQGRGGQTLFRSADACSWVAPEGTAGLVVQAVASREQEVLAAAGPDGLLRSIDGGSAFAEELAPADRHFHAVAASAETWWAAATDLAGERLFLWTKEGQGSWLEREIERPAGMAAPIALSLLAARDRTAWLLVAPQGPDVLLQLDEGGATSHPLDVGTGTLTDLAVEDTAAGLRLWYVRDGLFLSSLSPDPAGGALIREDHLAFPPGLGIDLREGQLWTAPQSHLVGALLARSEDGGASFQTLAYPDDIVGPLSCPADSDVARVCEPLWELLLPRIRGFDTPVVDTGTPPEVTSIPPHPEDPEDSAVVVPAQRGSCGCTQSGSDRLAVLLLLAVGWTSYGRQRR
jgi:hypothetical protein